jgi:type I restriction enzyme S subunit
VSARERLQATVRDGGSVDVAGAVIDHLDLWTGAVTKKSSSGRGSSGKIELTGIKRLRELILELALSGRLTEPEPDEEPAHRLLSRIEAEKSRLAAQGLIKRPKTLPDAGDSQPYSLPPHWCWVWLGSVTNYGTTDKAEPNQVAQNTWVLELEDIEKESSRLLSKVRYTERQFKSSKNRFARGDVLYGKLRPYLDKVLVADEPGVCTTEIIPIRGYLGLLPEFLRLALKSPSFKRYANDSTHGMNLPRLGTDKARLAMIPLAPEQEQHRIVQKVDELMALCDRLEQQTGDQLEAHETLVDTLLGTLTKSENATELADNWARLAAHFDTLFTTEQSIDKLRQTILQLAVMGRLVEQDAKDEPTTQLLERVSNEKQRLIQSKVLKRTKSLAPLETSALSSIPESWLWVNLGDIISVMDAGWSPACPPRPADPEKWGVLKTTAVQVMKYQEFENKQLPENKTPKEQYEVRSGDILITRAGPKNRVGISCVVKETRDKLMISDKIIRFHLIETGLSEEYICLCLNAGETYNYLEQAKSGMAESQMNISQDKLKAAPVPLCPANEQHRIVQKVDELIALCDQLKERLNQASETRCQLAEAVVEKGLSA